MGIPEYLPGNPPMYGVKQELASYYQGNPITVDFNITVTSELILVAYLKSTKDTNLVVWKGFEHAGIDINQGKPSVTIKSAQSRNIPAGYYYLTLACSTFKDQGDVRTVLDEVPISIIATSGSPKPIP